MRRATPRRVLRLCGPLGLSGGLLAGAVVALAGLGAAAERSGAATPARAAHPAAAHHAFAPAWTSLFPARLENLQRCDQFEMTVEVWEGVDIAGFQLEIAYDPTVLYFRSASVAPWMADQWGSYFTPPPDISDGNVLFAAVADDDAGAASGDGAMGLMTFQAVGPGESPLDLHGVVLVNPDNETEAVTSTDATVHVVDELGPGCFPTATFTPPSQPPPTPATVTPTATSGSEPTPTAATVTPAVSPTAGGSPEPGTPSPTAGAPTVTAEVTPTQPPEGSATPPPTATTGPGPPTARLFVPSAARP